MNIRHFTFSLLFFSLTIIISCSSENPFAICKVREYDCDYQHRIPGIITITKGSSRKHYFLTEKGLEKIRIKEGEPLAFNPKNRLAIAKEVTDSSIDIFTIDTDSGKRISPNISLKPHSIKDENGQTLLSVPILLSSCIQNDGTIVLLLNFEFGNLENTSYNRVFLYVYEKGDIKKIKKYDLPHYTLDENGYKGNYAERPHNLQCTGGDIYLFSEKNYSNGNPYYDKYYSQPNWFLNKINLDPQKNEANTEILAFIAYDDIRLNRYSEQENTIYTVAFSSEDEMEILHKISLSEGYELPDEPVEKENGEFLFSETTNGKSLVFFIKNRTNPDEEEKLELIKP